MESIGGLAVLSTEGKYEVLDDSRIGRKPGEFE
jgi:hypothetical protein